MRKTAIIVTLSLLAALQFTGCGSGSGSSDSLPPKTAKIVFTASTSAALPVPVGTINIVANIPPGVSVPLTSGGTPVFSTPKTGAFTGGSFIQSRLTISLVADVTSPSGLGADNVGPFAEIVVSYPAGLALTEASFTGINNPFPDFVAMDQLSSPEKLTNFLKPSMKVTF